MKFYTIIIIVSILSCQNRQEEKSILNHDTSQDDLQVSIPEDTARLEEIFIDSTNVGRKTLNKVEVFKYRSIDSNFVDIKFYTKKSGKWIFNQTLHFLKDGILGCDTELSDFNNDGLNDMTIVSDIAARGANQVRRLFIYDKSTDRLVEMKNSEDYPNMLYNKDLNCIDAFLVYGGCSTVFLRISGDSLREFASVDVFAGLTVQELDNAGHKRIIFQDTTYNTNYVRFKNYKPLKEYDDY